MDKKSQFKKLLPMILMFAVSVAIGITGATVLHTLTLENPIKTPTVEGEVEEDLEKGGKKISFINTGEADVFIRASISESWTYEKDGKSCILPNIVESTKVASPYGNVAEVFGSSIGHKDGGGTDWVYNPSDGWYYYRKVLPGSKAKGSNETAKKTALLVEGVDFSQLSSVLQTDERYKDAIYELHCTMEVVQASDEKEVSIAAVKKMFFNDNDANLPKNFLGNWPGSWSKPEEWTDEWKNEFDSAPTHDTKYQVDISWN